MNSPKNPARSNGQAAQGNRGLNSARFSADFPVRVAVQQNVPDDSGSGQPKPHWATKFPHWANVIPRGGSEKHLFSLLRAEIDYIVRMRYDSLTKPVIPADWRLVLPAGEILNIDSRIDVKYAHVEFEYHCIEVPA